MNILNRYANYAYYAYMFIGVHILVSKHHRRKTSANKTLLKYN